MEYVAAGFFAIAIVTMLFPMHVMLVGGLLIVVVAGVRSLVASR